MAAEGQSERVQMVALLGAGVVAVPIFRRLGTSDAEAEAVARRRRRGGRPTGQVPVVGSGRFAQVASQSLLARGFDVSIIENDVEMIDATARFGFKVYCGDGTRLDTLRTSGAGEARAVLVCVDKKEPAEKIVELIKADFPLAKLFVRAFDRGHAMDLVRAGVDFQIRETFESAMAFGEAGLTALGVPEDEAPEIAEDVRRDSERFDLQVAGDIFSGTSLMRGDAPIPTPLTKPRRAGTIVDQGKEQALSV